MSSQDSMQKFNQAGQLFKAGQYGEALDLLQELDRAVPQNKEVLHSMVLCLERLGRAPEALRLCERLQIQFQDPRVEAIRARLSAMDDGGMPGMGINLDFDISAPRAATPAPAAAPKVERETSSSRIVSVDVLRGFVMLFIMAGGDYSRAFEHISKEGFWGFLAVQMEHPGWEGLRFYDLIFPTFIFLIGVSLVISLDKIVAKEGKSEAYKRVFKRFAVLFALGIACDLGMAEITKENVVCGVLQRLALCYFFTSLLYLNFDTKALIGICAGILIGYWALIAFVPVPGLGAVSMARGECWPHFIDKKIPPYFGTDPEGLFSTVTAVCTCLLGVFAGVFLRDNDLDEKQVPLRLAAAGLICLVVGYAWWYALDVPAIKRLWNTTYVLCAGGYSLLFLAFFYWIIDVMEWQGPWMQPFIWVGMNPLVIYVASEANLVDFEKIARMFIGGPIEKAFGLYGPLLVACGSLAVALVFMRFLYQRKIFIRA